MKNSFERTLPQGYDKVYEIDAKNKKTAILLNLSSLAIMAVIIVPAYFIIKPSDFIENYSLARNIGFLVILSVYIVLHELVHGIAYKLQTGERLKFGISFSCAYCGVPDIFVYRKPAIIAVLAPVVVFSVIFIAAILICSDLWDKFYLAAIFAIHFSCSVGDLYDALLYFTRFKSPDVLMQDTGPKQTFYIKQK